MGICRRRCSRARETPRYSSDGWEPPQEIPYAPPPATPVHERQALYGTGPGKLRGEPLASSPWWHRNRSASIDGAMLSEPRALGIESLHEKYGERIRRYLERLVGSADAEDLAQDVFEKAQRAVGTFRRDSRVLTWLYRIATNAAIDRLRTAGRYVDVERHDDETDPLDAARSAEATHERSLDGEVDRTRMRACILDVVEQLPTSQRAAILLGELRGLSDRELAEALGVSLGAAKIRLHRARGALKAALERACTFERDEQNEFACAPKPGLVSLGRGK
ncbi:RNA polymerase sigma factor [Anaeromyxobacter sp. SG26]|uniref:RNA polymerase sigma factor n=1 Tax=Anaeromyxobacter sp. SG26 TaxID=2925407 RepID=UPI001F589C89|nr:sigma-70 family RNA polymerase sigma factor [Anaeromyxobacter sp. SG26]